MNSKQLAFFNTLSDNEKQLLFVLAVFYEPIRAPDFQELLDKSAVLPELAQTITNRNVKVKLNKNLIDVTTDGWQCQQDVVESLMRLAVKQPWFETLSSFLLNEHKFGNRYYYSPRLAVFKNARRLRIYLYQHNEKGYFSELFTLSSHHTSYYADILYQIFFCSFDDVWFAALPEDIIFSVLNYFLNNVFQDFSKYTLQYQLLERFFGKEKSEKTVIVQLVIEQRLRRGNFQDAESWLMGDMSARGLELIATLRFLQNRYNEALQLFNESLKTLKKPSGKRNISLTGLPGYFYNLLLLRDRSFESLSLLKQNSQITIKYGSQHGFYWLYCILLEAVEIYQGKLSVEKCVRLLERKDSAYELLFQILLVYWLGEINAMKLRNPNFLDRLAEFCLSAQQHGYAWYAAVSSVLLRRLNCQNADCRLIAQQYQDSPFLEIIDLLPQVSKWQRALEALTQLNKAPSIAQVNQQTRMVWEISLAGNYPALAPKEQKLGKNGRWTKGRPIALKRLFQDLAEFDYLSEQDHHICAHIKFYKERNHGYYPKESYEMPYEAIFSAVGHPLIFWSDQESSDIPVEISVTEPQLLVKEKDNSLHISLLPKISDHKIVAQRSSNNGLLVYKINDQHRQVAEILGNEGLSVPVAARQQVIDSIASIASMLIVQSDIGGSSSYAESVATDSRLHIHLQPVGLGLQIEVFVQPFNNGGPLLKPGIGGATVLAEIEGKQFQTTRDFALENKYLKQFLNECSELSADKEFNWLLGEPEAALEVLLHLQAMSDFVVLEWPKGKKIRIKEVDLKQTKFSIRKEKDWFSVEGSLQINEQEVLDIQHLMRLLNSSPGRFLKLEDGQVIALTRELRQRLDDLSGFGDLQKDKIRFHPLAAQTLDDITTGMNISAGKPWQDQLKRLNDISNIDPKIPSTLQCELRDYQRDGYVWLTRLAHWGAGACLADDMGLGKTVQALALILSRAPNGPTLILAPTSVCINWLEECLRFAPTLNVHQFGSGDRQVMLDGAGPFDVIVCSYGLLQTEGERLAQKQWQTLVADEAQAFKNALTKRSKAVMALQADFKMITTGTPIENHLGELWNLFNFINPGLLGTLQKFNERYAQPIENLQDTSVKQRLRKLLRPFILRRLKNDVLTELPSRTEVTLHIDLSKEERALYEAMRRNALQAMLEVSEHQGATHLKVLTEIMKLRRACCHPRLVMEGSSVASSKLEAFEKLVDELLENRHKALVFSQFVGHLTLIRELLDKKGIAYHYLDGSTPVAQRKSAMNAFQAGDGDLFLISLKAGGTGLNLTAADYVIHMDPWWNPAVEDQASDRAHRMGQQRPVTIYRLVAKDTIEDKIVDLHKHKRDLANSLLEGGEVSGKMSVEDMMALIKDIE